MHAGRSVALCKTCESQGKLCHNCHEVKLFTEFHPEQRELVESQCLVCLPYKKCARCPAENPQTAFRPWQWQNDHICESFLLKKQSTKRCSGTCKKELPREAFED